MRRVDLQVYGLPVDTLVVTRYPGSLILNLPLHVEKLVKLAPGYMVKLCPFLLTLHACRGMRHMDLVVFGLV